MNFARCALGCSVALILVACGGSTSSNGGTCSIAGGTYTQHFTAEAGGTNCPDVADQTITINGNETLSGDSGSGPSDGGNGCTTNVNGSTCTVTTACTITSGGFTSNFATSLTFNGSSGTGKETMSSTDATGRTLSSCTYDIAMTKH